jgi:light-regulated signal transduction histidine kinase (bacteriophytochrome)
VLYLLAVAGLQLKMASLSTQDATSGSVAEQRKITRKELSECDMEKLHLLGHIQGDAGHVLFVSYPEGQIVAADAEVRCVPWIQDRDDNGTKGPQAAAAAASKSMTDHQKAALAMLGTNLESWIPSDLRSDLWEAIDNMIQAQSRRMFHFYLHDQISYAITLSTTADEYSSIGIEIEKIEKDEACGDFYNSLISLSRIMEFYADEKVLRTACDSIFNLLGSFDRGMVYKFNDDNSGEVIYETKKDTVQTSYFGMRFPASDIPLPARQLYIKNGLRYIRDANCRDIPILHDSDTVVNLTHCRMRACAKPHVMYLQNMGIRSSMSIAIVAEDRLWGLLSFHGYGEPYKPSLHQRIACETVRLVHLKIDYLLSRPLHL